MVTPTTRATRRARAAERSRARRASSPQWAAGLAPVEYAEHYSWGHARIEANPRARENITLRHACAGCGHSPTDHGIDRPVEGLGFLATFSPCLLYSCACAGYVRPT